MTRLTAILAPILDIGKVGHFTKVFTEDRLFAVVAVGLSL
jgi:hypothetical protein